VHVCSGREGADTCIVEDRRDLPERRIGKANQPQRKGAASFVKYFALGAPFAFEQAVQLARVHRPLPGDVAQRTAPQTIYFSDRPVRVAGHITMPAFLEEWTTAAGPNNFSKDPPNATLSVYEPGKESNTLTVVEISKPVVDGKDLVYSYKLVEGKMPSSGGVSALFIDWIGPGGGVGVGFHGVGVGRRGVGWR